jgi:acyl-CoA synthetase (NDP forming)
VAVTLTSKGLGVSYSISTGNEAASGVEDYVEYLLDDPHTHVLALVVEQFRQPRRFLDLARRAQMRGKAIVLLHPGRSRAARESAATHTGVLAGDYDVMCAKVRREGVVLADTLEEFSDILDVILRCPVRRGPASKPATTRTGCRRPRYVVFEFMGRSNLFFP